MAYPNVEPGFETFFEPTRIWLFGKEFKSLTYDRGSMGNPKGPDKAGEFTDLRAAAVPDDAGLLNQLRMPPRRVERALRRQNYQYTKDAQGNEVVEVNPPIFARIYSFSFEGHYYKLPRPLLFLVSGAKHAIDKLTGTPVQEIIDSETEPKKEKSGIGAITFQTKFTGIEGRDWNFSSDIRGWAVDKSDIAVCLDLEVGPYREILLDSTIAFHEEMASRGSANSRGSASSRGSAASRGSASFRGSVLGPHQDR